MKKSVVVVSIIVCIVIILSIVQVTVANMISTKGIEVSKMEQAIQDYKRKNTLMKEKILEQASYTEIASKAATLGFVEEKNSVYLSTPLPLARR